MATKPVIERLLLIGSASVHTWRYLSGIAPHVGEVFLVSNGEPPAERTPENLSGVFAFDFSLKAIGGARKMMRWIDEVHPTLAHVHQANSVAWHARRALKERRIPWLLTTWGSDVLLLPKESGLMRRMVSANLEAASRITSDSLYMAGEIRKLAPAAAPVAVLNFGIDTLPPEPNLAAKKKQVLSCRLHKKLYRINTILDAWAALEADGHFADWSLVVAANGEETAALKHQAAHLGLRNIEFVGFVDQARLHELYRESRVFVSVPESDATSVSLLEAMGHGCLPLLSNLPANLEWVIDGLNGHIAPDIGVLAEALKRAVVQANDPAQLAEAAALNRRLVIDKALHHSNMQAFAELYHTVLQGPSPQ